MASHSLIVKSKQNFYKFTLTNNIQEKKISTERAFSSNGLQLLREFWYVPARPIFLIEMHQEDGIQTPFLQISGIEPSTPGPSHKFPP